MDDPEQARAYSDADFADAHDAFVANVAAAFPTITGRVIDLGCGPADVTVRFARAFPGCVVVGVDAGENMLALAHERALRAGLAGRLAFERRHLPDPDLAGNGFDAVISNSLLHHLDDPLTLWHTVLACARPGAPVAVGDLCRPASRVELDSLVARYAHGAPDVLRTDFAHSLAAAYEPDEIRAQLREAGLAHFTVAVTTDRHVLVTGRTPE